MMLAALALRVHAQPADTASVNPGVGKHYVRHVVWTTPVFKNTTINGLGIGLAADTWGVADYLQVNGMSVDLNLGGILLTHYFVFGTIFSFWSTQKDTSTYNANLFASRYAYNLPYEKVEGRRNGTLINGLDLAFVHAEETNINGLSIIGFGSIARQMKGLEISGLGNFHANFRGVMIAALQNKSTQGKGLQIGLINSCKDCSVLQIGLINTIGKRTLPFINLRFLKN